MVVALTPAKQPLVVSDMHTAWGKSFGVATYISTPVGSLPAILAGDGA